MRACGWQHAGGVGVGGALFPLARVMAPSDRAISLVLGIEERRF